MIVLDAFNKTPVGLTSQELYSYYLTLEIDDSQGNSIFTGYNYVVNMTATFTFKVPADVVAGEYTVKAQSSYVVSPAIRKIRIRDYPRNQLNI